MEESVLEFHLEYNPHRSNPAEVFHAMGDFISAYEKFGRIIAQSVDSELIFDVELKEVTHGCILAKLFLRYVEEWTRPDDLIRSLTGEASQLADIQKVTSKERKRLKLKMHATNRYKNRIDPIISDLDVALVMEQWSKANQQLNPDEHLTVCKEGENHTNTVPFDPSFRYTGNTKKLFSHYKASHDGEELIEIYRPCCSGDSKWEVKSRKTGRKFLAEITHKEWLEDYQNSEERLGGSDYLRVHSQYDIFDVNGDEQIKNAKIIEVIEIIEHKGSQDEFPL